VTIPIAIADRAAKLLFYGLILVAPMCGGSSGGGDAPLGPPPPGFVYEVLEDRGDTCALTHASIQGVDVARCPGGVKEKAFIEKMFLCRILRVMDSTDDADAGVTLEGGCACGGIRYRMESPPLFVHCCHCRWCQRESGASYALNALIEAERVILLEGEPEVTPTPSNSGKAQNVWRCPECRVAVWSHYAGFGDKVSFVFVKDVTVVEGEKTDWDKLKKKDRVTVHWKFVDRPRKAYKVIVLPKKEEDDE